MSARAVTPLLAFAVPARRRSALVCVRATSNLLSLRDHCEKFLVFRFIDRVGMLIVGEHAFFYLRHALPDTPVTATSVSLAKRLVNFGLKSVDAEKVVAKQDLAVTTDAGADADGWNRELLEMSLVILAGTASNSICEAPGVLYC